MCVAPVGRLQGEVAIRVVGIAWRPGLVSRLKVRVHQYICGLHIKLDCEIVVTENSVHLLVGALCLCEIDFPGHKYHTPAWLR